MLWQNGYFLGIVIMGVKHLNPHHMGSLVWTIGAPSMEIIER